LVKNSNKSESLYYNIFKEILPTVKLKYLK